MDSVRKLIVDRVKETGLDYAALSRAVGKNHAYIQQFITRGSPAKLPEDVRETLARELGVPEALLRGNAPDEPNAAVGGAVRLASRIPLYGQAEAGRDGSFPLNGNHIQDIIAPPALASIAGAYAVMVVGDSMEPRYFAGETVFVNPRAPIRRNDFVVAQIAADEGEPPLAFIKRFVSRERTRLRLQQLNPRKDLEFPVARVVSVHRIVMGGEG